MALLIIFFFSSFNGFSQNIQPDPHYRLVKSSDYVQSKNYYLLTLFQEIPAVKKMLSDDPVLKQIGKNKVDSVAGALEACGSNGLCYTASMKFSDSDIASVSARLKFLYKPTNAIGKLVREHLIPSGTYILFQNLPAEEMLVKAWTQDAQGINFTIGVYAEGKKPNYPLIDSISFNTRDPRNNSLFGSGYVNLLYNATSVALVENKEDPSFFSLPLTAALEFLEMNERGQAADFEPMTSGQNQAAYEKIKTTKWENYKYSVILVPGAGPEEPAMALSAEGMLRCRLAAANFKQGMAPFIIVSGGKVHPYKTKFCEATEMKKYLVEKLHVPANAVLIDPHARHTTTNMRNAARIIFRYGIPFLKPAITCTTRGQSLMIEKTLIDRCKRELNEVPYRNGARLSETAVEFYPLPEALHINPTEPMDP